MLHRIGQAIFVFLIVMIALPAAAQDEEVTIRVQLTDRSQISDLTRVMSIDGVEGLEVTGGASPKQLEILKSRGYSFEITERAKQPEQATMCGSGWVGNPSRSYNCYPTYDQYTALMQRFASDNPTIIKLESIGSSTNTTSPHELWVVKISDNVNDEEDEPEMFYTASMHGDETTGFVLMLRLIDELQAGYGSDTEMTELVDNNEIWINPAANPDGTYYGSDNDVSSSIRYYTTASGANSYIDPNRNFPDPDPSGGPHPDGEAYAVETQAMMDFADAHSFVLAANFHGGAEVLNYPWDTWSRLHIDTDWWEDVLTEYAVQAKADASSAGNSSYLTDVVTDGVTNGYAWYTTEGGRQDFMNYWQGCREVTIELSGTKTLAASQLDAHWQYNRQALLDFIKQASEGIRGVVTDAGSGDPLAATIELVGYDASIDNSYVFTDPDVGDYHRMVLPGTYTVRFTADGYAPLQVSGVTVVDGIATIVNAQLSPPEFGSVTGQVFAPATRVPLAGVTVDVVDGGVSASTDGSGVYTMAAVQTGTYTFRVSVAGYETVEVERTVVKPDNVFNFALGTTEQTFSTDLDSSNGGLSGSGGWQWGAPSGFGAPSAHSSPNVWATNLSGEYGNYANSTLDLSNVTVPASSPELTFWHSYEIEQDWDGGNIKARPASSGDYTLIEGVEGYSEVNVSALNEPGFTGMQTTWTQVSVDLTPWAGQNIDLRWHFMSDGYATELGWYVDDVVITGAVAHVADFEYAPDTIDVGDEVQFTDRTTGAVTAWSWDFGDSSSSSDQNPAHTFESAGDFSVTLTATLPEGTLQKTIVISVGGGLPVVIFEGDFESNDFSQWSQLVN